MCRALGYSTGRMWHNLNYCTAGIWQSWDRARPGIRQGQDSAQSGYGTVRMQHGWATARPGFGTEWIWHGQDAARMGYGKARIRHRVDMARSGCSTDGIRQGQDSAQSGYGTVRMQHGWDTARPGFGTEWIWHGQDAARMGYGKAKAQQGRGTAWQERGLTHSVTGSTPNTTFTNSLQRDFPSSHTSPLPNPWESFPPNVRCGLGLLCLALAGHWDCFPFRDLAEKPVWVKTGLNPNPAAQRSLQLSWAEPKFGTLWVGFPPCGPSDCPGGPVQGQGHNHPPPSPAQKEFGASGCAQGRNSAGSRIPRLEAELGAVDGAGSEFLSMALTLSLSPLSSDSPHSPSGPSPFNPCVPSILVSPQVPAPQSLCPLMSQPLNPRVPSILVSPHVLAPQSLCPFSPLCPLRSQSPQSSCPLNP
ncbi:PREDICTED: uncharacterized protein LOC101817307 isoform X2 [Ficedula albicollis]|uniref:uncharacterized protein LOC101817307 isoform X2 n=1 Tax=Ficedula albicollis TaxID=59894 RepID=UPI0007AD845A|nr:PREDICTED: uncharacterized protein LOC101817307 isoform X2 [Ficedula albicollis]